MKKLQSIAPALCIAVSLLTSGPALAEDRASARDARAMLERAVVALKADEPKALGEIKRGGGFRDRDL
jgi:hypothetical protein